MCDCEHCRGQDKECGCDSCVESGCACTDADFDAFEDYEDERNHGDDERVPNTRDEWEK